MVGGREVVVYQRGYGYMELGSFCQCSLTALALLVSCYLTYCILVAAKSTHNKLQNNLDRWVIHEHTLSKHTFQVVPNYIWFIVALESMVLSRQNVLFAYTSRSSWRPINNVPDFK